ncbi:MAG: four helix bundle protein [Flexistipes sinusarabici]|uniref:Four helix bundle protein n=1 Tax=Flexistipes sinusarabici TaxID=2352 RepID=A0A5D0MNE9_FLESI|nr:four helix bundle protein [Flexistipes sinusarabici]TYB33922.1 MAG: four helix bundle protein [Flexistipes sinusarabici]
MELGKLEVYQISLKLSEEIWNIYSILPADLNFNIGSQVLRSIDSIGANVAEGFGRFHYRDSIKFYYNARGSLWESKHWVYLLNKRELIENEKYEKIVIDMEMLGKKLNGFIKSIKEKSNDK